MDEDFGGFEAADPIDYVEAEACHGLEATPSPWAALISGSNAVPGVEPGGDDAGFRVDFDEAFNRAAKVTTDVADKNASVLSTTPGNAGIESEGRVANEGGDRRASSDDTPTSQSSAGSTDEDSRRVTKEMERLREHEQRLASRLESTTKELTQQKEDYSLLQARHQSELESLRQAGHTALVAIVDEYKGRGEQVALEAKQAADSSVKESLQLQQQLIDSLLRAQEAKLAQHFVDQNSEMKTLLRQENSDAKQQQQEAIDAAVSAERGRGEEVTRSAIQDLTETYERQLASAVENERDRSRQLAKEQKDELLELLGAERQRGVAAAKSALEAERALAQEHFRAALKLERQHHSDIQNEVLEKAKRETKSYLEDQRQVDGRVTRRAVSSIDLFLQAASQQVQLLLSHKDEEEEEQEEEKDEEEKEEEEEEKD